MASADSHDRDGPFARHLFWDSYLPYADPPPTLLNKSTQDAGGTPIAGLAGMVPFQFLITAVSVRRMPRVVGWLPRLDRVDLHAGGERVQVVPVQKRAQPVMY